MKSDSIKKLINGNGLSLVEMNELLPCEIVLKKTHNTPAHIIDLKTQLSKRENEIAQLITRGLKNIEIAKQLNIAYETVKTHRKNIFRKLQINHVSQLIHLKF